MNSASFSNSSADWTKRPPAIARLFFFGRPIPKAHSNLGNILSKRGRLDEAIASYREALRLRPDFAEAANNLALVFAEQRRWDDAIALYLQALRIQPNSAEIHNNLSLALANRGRLGEAMQHGKEALRLRPDDAGMHNNMSGIFKDLGLLDEALAACRRAVELQPGSPIHHTNLIYTLHFHPHSDALLLGEEGRRWDARHAAPLASSILPHANTPDPIRRLKIGYVSAHLYRHVVGLFMLPLLEAHDRREAEVFCYASIAVSDDVTRRLESFSDRWQNTFGKTDEELANLIRADEIDILIDLTAHMAHNRLLTFARKPAPIQVTYLAYCSTTGLSAMDYRFTDPFLDPPEVNTEYYSEASVRLPETYWCYQLLDTLPPIAPLPAVKQGYLTFGCLNNFCKVTALTLTVWRDLLRGVPNSRLLLHAHDGPHRDRVKQFFSDGDVDSSRVEFVGMQKTLEYLHVYDRIDIALDPFPYGEERRHAMRSGWAYRLLVL